MTNLGEKCKEIVELLYFKGFTQKEASEALQMPLDIINYEPKLYSTIKSYGIIIWILKHT